MPTERYSRFAAVCAGVTAIADFLYAVAFLFLARSYPAAGAFFSALFLTLGGAFAVAALLAPYARFRSTYPIFALLALKAMVISDGRVGHGILLVPVFGSRAEGRRELLALGRRPLAVFEVGF